MRTFQQWVLALILVIGLISVMAVGGPVPTSAQQASNRSIPVGPGFTDVSPHQIVRTSASILYIIIPTCDSYPSCPNNSLRVYRAQGSGVPTGFTEQDSAHRPTGIGSSAIAIDAQDVIHVAWNDRAGMLNYRTFATSTNTWSATTAIASTNWTTFGQGDEGVALALDPDGVPHAAFTVIAGGVRRVSYLNKLGGTWSSPTIVDDAPFGVNQSTWHPTLAFYPNGDLLLAWFVGSFNYTPDGTLHFRTRQFSDGSWGQRATIVGDTLMTAIDNGPSLLITADGTAHVTFLSAGPAANGQGTAGDYVHAYYNNGGGWTANHPGNGTQITHNPSLGPGPNGTVRIYGHGWQGGSIDGHGDDLYYFQGGAGGWGPWTLYVTGAFDSSVSTRWSQFFHAFPELLDIAYWADPYPNMAWAGVDVTAGDTPTSTPTPTSTAAPTSTPVPPPTATPTQAASACTVRPKVGIATLAVGPGKLQATVTATTSSSLPTNSLSQIRLISIRNAAVRLNGNPVVEGQTTMLATGTQSVTLLLDRTAPGQDPTRASTVAFAVNDACGEWRSFVGGGPTAF